MTDKEKIREEVERLKSNLIHGACASQIAMETRCKEEAYNEVLALLDTMQEEPVSDIEAYQSRWGKSIGFIDYSTSEEIGDYDHKAVMESLHPQLKEEPVSEDFEKIVEEIAEPTILNAYGTKELARRLRNTICGTFVSEDLGEYINELSKQFPEVSFAKLSRIAVRVAKWQKQQMMAKAIDGDITFDYYGDDDKTYGCIAQDSFCLEDFGLKDRDKVKMILIKDDKL